MIKLSKRTQAIKPSVTLAITARAKALRSQGIDLVNFAAGEPDFDTPNRIKEAAVQALNNGMTKYTDVRGIVPLREAVVETCQRDYGLQYGIDEVLISCGGKHSLYNLYQALFDEGDEVIIPSPYWVSYPDMALLCGAVPKIIPTKEENGCSGSAPLAGSRLRRILAQEPQLPALGSGGSAASKRGR